MRTLGTANGILVLDDSDMVETIPPPSEVFPDETNHPDSDTYEVDPPTLRSPCWATNYGWEE